MVQVHEFSEREARQKLDWENTGSVNQMPKSRQWFASMAVFLARDFCSDRRNWSASRGNLVSAGCGYALNGPPCRFWLKRRGDAGRRLSPRRAGMDAGGGGECFDARK